MDKELIGIIAGVALVGLGITIYFMPVKILLELDYERGGTRAYQRKLKSTGDEKQALAAARRFYKGFGLATFALGALTAVGLLIYRSQR